MPTAAAVRVGVGTHPTGSLSDLVEPVVVSCEVPTFEHFSDVMLTGRWPVGPSIPIEATSVYCGKQRFPFDDLADVDHGGLVQR